MTKRMLIDATHEEETRVAVVDGKRLAEFDYESKHRKPLKGSIFLAKVTRVEPSLQAAFVNFGGNRHGFLPFSEIHPDYFRIPIADREALIAEQEAALEAESQEEEESEETGPEEENADDRGNRDEEDDESDIDGNLQEPEDEDEPDGNSKDFEEGSNKKSGRGGRGRYQGRGKRGGRGGRGGRGRSNYRNRQVETFGGDEYTEEQKFRFKLRRKYKIQEVIKRGQIMLVQASKEERGNKGAAVSSYLSLPGRYCVLMPNSPSAGGVSRKIASYKDRNRMRDIIKDLNIPKGMSVIVRTAGVSRTKPEIKRDLDYLMRLWDNIRELTLQSSAPAMVYEEADLIKRAVRDLYARDIEEVHVAGEEGFKTAKNFMKMMIPSHVKKVQEHKDQDVPLFNRYHVEEQIAEIGDSHVTLPSGGYLVINPTEALVSIDVNSGKATKERHIEATALKTNLESAVEVARQLRLRDLGGLIVIDFIDMEDRRNNAKVERKMREALSEDRARIQMERISSFGLMELSRQRLSPSLTESQFEICSHCSGVGRVRTADATSIMALRAIEDEGIKGRAAQVIVHVANDVALYILNNKKKNVAELEARYGFKIQIRVDEDIGISDYRVEVSKPVARDGEKNNQGDKDEKGGKSDRGGRRGRRGGRGRGRKDRSSSGSAADRSFIDDLNEELESEIPINTKDKKEEEKEGEKPKRRGRPKKAAAEGAQKDVKKPAAKKPASKTAKAKDKDDDVAKSKATEEKPKAKKTAKTPKKKTSKPSNDHEVVNQAPKEKKKGWWNR